MAQCPCYLTDWALIFPPYFLVEFSWFLWRRILSSGHLCPLQTWLWKELVAVQLCWCCCRNFIMEWYREDVFGTDIPLSRCRQSAFGTWVCAFAKCCAHVWTDQLGARSRVSLLPSFRWCCRVPNIVTWPVLILLSPPAKAMPISAQL